MCRYEYIRVGTREKPAVLFLSLCPPCVLRQSFSLGSRPQGSAWLCLPSGQITSMCHRAQLFTCVLRPHIHVLMLVPQALYQMAYLQPQEVIFLSTLASRPQYRTASPLSFLTLGCCCLPPPPHHHHLFGDLSNTMESSHSSAPELPSLQSCSTAWKKKKKNRKRWESLPLSSAPTYRSESHDFVLERMDMR